MEQVAFFVGAIGALGGAIAVILLRNPFYSVLALVVHLFSLAGLFLMLHAEFVAASQVVVYAGAVMVLYVFVAAYVGGIEEPLWDAIPGQRILAPLIGVALFVELSIAILGTSLKSLASEGAEVPLGWGSPEAIGRLLLERFLIPFEAASLLLLIAAVGAVVLAARRPDLPASGGSGPGNPGATSRSSPCERDGRGRWRSDRHSDARRGDSQQRAAVWPSVVGRTSTAPDHPSPRWNALMDITWYLVLSALLFSIGAGGLLVRRNPLVMLLCLELMLNSANLALLAFSRSLGDQDGQIFALIVMVVAACEVVVGLGLIVAMYRRRLALDVDEMRRLRG